MARLGGLKKVARESIPARSSLLTLAGGFIVVRLGVLKRVAREWNSLAQIIKSRRDLVIAAERRCATL
ncbi:MAG: hypothetical protein GTO63_35425 [Anaerolineae bacterium]|nr:hypothetical protein [Anaerolineae bacterium]NIO00027.1 hypothetical protein [Anaerolineae bacterium]NIQ82794.1 hypothetical protein [Anaerolineae bacterium]